MSTIKGSAVLSSGATIRVVDAGVGAVPRYTVEVEQGPDAMGVMRWYSLGTFSMQDVLDILKAVGWLA
jgi:hypothetical protein